MDEKEVVSAKTNNLLDSVLKKFNLERLNKLMADVSKTMFIIIDYKTIYKNNFSDFGSARSCLHGDLSKEYEENGSKTRSKLDC